MINMVVGRLTQALTVILLVAALSSCGLKGDLYLPEPEKPAATDQAVNPDNTETSNVAGTSISTAEDEEKPTDKAAEGTSPQP